MIKTIIVSIDELETYLNKSWYSFLTNYQDKMIFKYKEKTSREIKAKTDTERFFELDDMQIDDYSYKIAEKLWLDPRFVFEEIKKFISYRTEKSEWAVKCKWQKQNSFEVPLRLQTWFSNVKSKPKVNLEINMI